MRIKFRDIIVSDSEKIEGYLSLKLWGLLYKSFVVFKVFKIPPGEDNFVNDKSIFVCLTSGISKSFLLKDFIERERHMFPLCHFDDSTSIETLKIYVEEAEIPKSFYDYISCVFTTKILTNRTRRLLDESLEPEITSAEFSAKINELENIMPETGNGRRNCATLDNARKVLNRLIDRENSTDSS